LLQHDASEDGAKEGATHIPHEDFCWAPIPEQKAKQGTHQGPKAATANNTGIQPATMTSRPSMKLVKLITAVAAIKSKKKATNQRQGPAAD
jgi:hypothetical protein